MIKQLKSPFLALLNTFQYISSAHIRQEVTRWEDYSIKNTGLSANHTIDVVINSKSDVQLLSANKFIYLNQDKKHFTQGDPGREEKFSAEDRYSLIYTTQGRSGRLPGGIIGGAYLIMAGSNDSIIKENPKTLNTKYLCNPYA